MEVYFPNMKISSEFGDFTAAKKYPPQSNDLLFSFSVSHSLFILVFDCLPYTLQFVLIPPDIPSYSIQEEREMMEKSTF